MDVRDTQKFRGGIVLISFVLGGFFYLYYRASVLQIDTLSLFNYQPALDLTSLFFAAFPSFIFMPLIIGTSLITLNCNTTALDSSVRPMIAFWLAIVLIFECLQEAGFGYLSRGTFDWLDITAAIVGSFISLLIFSSKATVDVNKDSMARYKTWKLPSLLFLGIGLIQGSIDMPQYCKGSNENEMCITPYVLSWEEIRAEIEPDVSSGEPLNRTGKIYQIDQWLLVVEKYRGIHFFDITDNLNPIRKIYLPIPGALDITVKEGVLYSSAFSDLVTIDLDRLLSTDGVEVVSSRQEDVFSPPLFQQFYPEVYFENSSGSYSKDDGVVIGYKTNSEKVILYGDKYAPGERKEIKTTTNLEEEDDDESSLGAGCLLLHIWLCGS